MKLGTHLLELLSFISVRRLRLPESQVAELIGLRLGR